MEALSRELEQPRGLYVVASDNIQVQDAARHYAVVEAVCFVEKSESLYRVAGDVLTLLDRVNAWLASLAEKDDDVASDLLHWTRHVEGGLTTQRLQDALLLVNSYVELLRTNRIDEAVVIADPATLWEDGIFVDTARAYGIPVRVTGVWQVDTLKATVHRYLKTTARPPYHMLGVIRTKVRWANRSSHAPGEDIVFQLCSPSRSHVENIAPIMRAVAARGYHPVALIWRAEAGAVSLRQQGFDVVHLEDFVSARAVWAAVRLSLRMIARATRRKVAFIADPELSYRRVQLGRALWPSIIHFLTAELPLRYVLDSAIERYVGERPPLAIKLWGGGLLFEGASFVRHAPRGRESVLMSWLWITEPAPGPYESRFEHLDLLLAAGATHEKYFELLGVPPEKVASVGPARYDHLAAFAARHTPTDSRVELGVRTDHTFHLLFDPNVAMRGYLSVADQARTIEAVLAVARRHTSCAVLIKPHPSQEPGMLEALLAGSRWKNVYLLDSSMLPYHAINAADAVMTKFSTLGIEAMILGKPLISPILDDEPQFKVFGEAAEYCMDTGKLIALLEKLVHDTDFRGHWVAERQEKQAHFLRSYRGENERPAAHLAADAIDMFIKKKRATWREGPERAGDHASD